MRSCLQPGLWGKLLPCLPSGKEIVLSMTGKDDEHYMRLALRQADTAFSKGEVPVGAVIVKDNSVIASACNSREMETDPTAHAEIKALRKGALETDSWRLSDATLYVTKEPCVMCAGAMVNARLGRLVFGCRDNRYGAVESRYRILSEGKLNHSVEVISGVLENECSDILKRFFQMRR